MNRIKGRLAACVALTAFASSIVLVACGSSDTQSDGANGPNQGNNSNNNNNNNNNRPDGSPNFGPDAQFAFDSSGKDAPFDPDAFFASDPPAQWCGPDGGTTVPPDPGGTPDCPGDKNRQGCPCPTVGATAACWPGHRVNRNHGVCHDGTTTCVASGEFGKSWGPCVGYQLPDPGATKGKPACRCFSAGQWSIANLSPCFVDNGGGSGSGGAVSTYQDGQGNAQCPQGTGTPTQPWSTDTLKVDCAGHYKLCYELKAGSSTAPTPSDCSVAKVCVEADYPTADQVFTFPTLPGWSTTDASCAQKFATTGGYGEMSVIGLSDLCDKVDDGSGNAYVFNRVGYCSLACNQNPHGPGCQGCSQGGSGGF